MDVLSFIQIHHLHAAIYLLLFLSLAFDATLTVFAAMLLLGQGVISPAPALAVLVLGVMAEQLLWYGLGRGLGRWQKLMNWLDRPAVVFDKHLLQRPRRTLLLSKFIYGIHRAMLVRAGMLGLDFKLYLKIALLCTAVWLLVLGILGYAFRESYEVLKRYVDYAELVPLGLVALYFFINWRLSKRLKQDL